MATSSYKEPPALFDPYSEWKLEVAIWQAYVEGKLDATKQGPALFLSLTGDARKAALKVQLTDMKKATGVDIILAELDKFFLKDKDRSAFLAYDKFTKYCRLDGMAVKDFLLKFELLRNSCITHGIDIPDKIVAHQMLQSANFHADKRELIITTISTFSSENMRSQILKIFAEEPVPSTHSNSQMIDVKTEPVDESCMTFYGSQSSNSQNRSRRSGQSRRNHGKSKYANFENSSRFSNSGRRINALDEHGNPLQCNYCCSIYHFEKNCPDAVDEKRNQRNSRYGDQSKQL